MTQQIRIVQYFNLTATGGPYLYQNYFVTKDQISYGYLPQKFALYFGLMLLELAATIDSL